ncbi:urease accessory protein UreD [Pseudoduganella namucuonensis]|uniref:Urease accessory protein UreD n=1 Tax=Pseudoduganella namucuonensis TaxID=1035707 RepID=A0A1I7GTR3_9BURK|nr:urease accessory protein UreD [Pseudoduganella namucuonensis]SFU51852.1 urease accessory protein [Pseudoduganella namucuonensis]
MPDCTVIRDPQASSGHGAWQASLVLGFADDAGTTRLVERRHAGPLRVQKPLYPEGPETCHAIVVHPPGGVVGGDQLELTARAGERARAFLTTPGAAKWYKANGKVSRQRVTLEAAAGAAIEWMPQETIFFDNAHVELDHDVLLAADASYLGCEILCMGRRASGESFTGGRVAQRTRIRRGGKLLWWEQGALTPRAVASPLGLAGRSVSATLIAAGAALPAAVLAELRALSDDPLFGATQMRQLLCVRLLGDDSEAARELMLAAWRIVRPHLLGRPAFEPRSWRT